MAEVGHWKIFSTFPLLGRDILTHDTLFLWERLYLKEHCVPCQELCPMVVYQVPAPFQSWDPLSCGLCHSAQPIPSRFTDTSTSNGGPAWEMMPRSVSQVFLSSQWQLAALILSLSHALSLLGSRRDRGTVPRGK